MLYLKGAEIKIETPADAVDSGIGYLSEDRKKYGLLLIQDVTFNIAVASLRKYTNKFGFYKKSPAVTLAKEGIKTLGIKTPSERQFLKNLSGGNQQKVLFSRMLLNSPRILIVDEPTKGVDVGSKRAIYDLITDLAKDGMAIILISSDLEEVLGLAHRVLVMRNGAIVNELSGDLMNEQMVLESAFATRG